jgi:hypothetical protein
LVRPFTGVALFGSAGLVEAPATVGVIFHVTTPDPIVDNAFNVQTPPALSEQPLPDGVLAPRETP